MKFVYWLFCSFILTITMFNGSAFSASSAEERLEVVDFVYEKTDGGTIMQVGDYLITKTVNVWLANSNGEDKRIPLRRIKAGARVKAQIVQQQEGQWVAENLYLLAEPSEQTESAQESDTSGGVDEIYLEDGTWKN